MLEVLTRGIQGPTTNPRGDWSAGTEYFLSDQVISPIDGHTYQLMVPGPVATAPGGPGNDTTLWRLVTRRGDITPELEASRDAVLAARAEAVTAAGTATGAAATVAGVAEAAATHAAAASGAAEVAVGARVEVLALAESAATSRTAAEQAAAGVAEQAEAIATEAAQSAVETATAVVGTSVAAAETARVAAELARTQAQAAVTLAPYTCQTLAQLAAIAPAEHTTGQVLADGLNTGTYVYEGGVWLRKSGATVPALDGRVGRIEATEYADDESPSAPYVYVLRGRGTGRVVLWVSPEGHVGLRPTQELIDAVQVADPVYDSVTLAAAEDEHPVIPLIASRNGRALLSATEDGHLLFTPAQETVAALRSSPLAALQVVDRLPSDADGASAYYEVGQDWVHGGRCYTCIQASPSAVWAPAKVHFPIAGNGYRDGRMPLPGDALPDVAPVVAAGLRRLVAAYTGPAALIGRDSDSATMALHFVGDDVDWPALRSFIAGTKGRVEILYNQGAGDDLTWTGANRPVLSPAPQVGAGASIVFEDSQTYGEWSSPHEGLLIPETISVQANSCSVFWAGSFAHSIVNAPVIELGVGADKLGYGVHDGTGRGGICVWWGSWLYTNWTPPIGALVVGFSSSPSGITSYMSDQASATFAPAASVTLAGGQLGTTSVFMAPDGVTAKEGRTIMGGILVWPRAVTGDEAALIRRCLEVSYDMRPQVRGSLIVVGDSIQAGDWASYYESIGRRVARLIHRPLNLYLVARGGGTYGSETDNWVSEAHMVTDGPSPLRIAVVALGTNDIAYYGSPVSTLTAALTTTLAALRSDGVDHILVETVRPRAAFVGTEKEQLRLDWNAHLRANWSTIFGADGLLDTDTLARVGAAGAASDTTLYVDGTHQTDLARGLEADWCAAHIDDLMIEKGLL